MLSVRGTVCRRVEIGLVVVRRVSRVCVVGLTCMTYVADNAGRMKACEKLRNT